jgi:hypothetical protein
MGSKAVEQAFNLEVGVFGGFGLFGGDGIDGDKGGGINRQLWHGKEMCW